ncbi:MAG: HD domain-containing protein, partial [Bythopirellula sp.]|nr:HD domain-containing protein [Bythopirellula sp.]
GPRLGLAKTQLLAAAILHDVGHGPFSHLFEPLLGINHEEWSCRIIESNATEVNRVLTKHEIPVGDVVALIKEKNREKPPWQKTLLSSELDVDRLDYLRRDSYFTGAGYGHFDWYRILNTVSLVEKDSSMVLAWPDSAKFAIEEYIFARFYMYQNVYQHKTTRGFEKLIHAAWRRAEQLETERGAPQFIPEIQQFRNAKKESKETIEQYLALEDSTLVYQLIVWSRHPDSVLADLATRFVTRRKFKAVNDPVPEGAIDGVRETWEEALRELVKKKGYNLPEYYALRDDRLKQTVYDPYAPEKEKKEQDPYNAILIDLGTVPTEISEVLTRLQAVTGERPKRNRYYVPEDVSEEARQLAESGSWK